MARKKLGHVELQWTCPNCGGINPGLEKTCQACGAPQPDDVEFEQASGQELITDEEKVAKAEAGADIHCPYCGTRNPAGVATCSQCGGDLSEGALRKAGRVVGAYKTGPIEMVPCPHCGAENPDTIVNCQQCGGGIHLETRAAGNSPSRNCPQIQPLADHRPYRRCGRRLWLSGFLLHAHRGIHRHRAKRSMAPIGTHRSIRSGHLPGLARPGSRRCRARQLPRRGAERAEPTGSES